MSPYEFMPWPTHASSLEILLGIGYKIVLRPPLANELNSLTVIHFACV